MKNNKKINYVVTKFLILVVHNKLLKAFTNVINVLIKASNRQILNEDYVFIYPFI